MLETILVVLLILWLLGAFGPRRYGGNLIHLLLVIVLILVIIRLI